MKNTITVAAAAVALAASVVSAHAGCADPRISTAASEHTIPAFIVAHLNSGTSSPAAKGAAPQTAAQNIVGTWLVTYRNEGKRFGQAFIQWHDDGTEWENINLPLSGGNICVGSWKTVDALHVSRLHVGWLYTSGSLSGFFVETETDAVNHPTRYIGTNDTKIFDLMGNLLAEVTGTSDAVKIVP